MDSASAIRIKKMLALLPDSLRKSMPPILDDKPLTEKPMSFKVAHALHDIANTYLELGTSAADWNPALTWVERAILLYRTPEYAITEANLLKKLGRTTDTPDVQK